MKNLLFPLHLTDLARVLIDQNITCEKLLQKNYLSCNIKWEATHAFYRPAGFQLAKTSHFFELAV